MDRRTGQQADRWTDRQIANPKIVNCLPNFAICISINLTDKNIKDFPSKTNLKSNQIKVQKMLFEKASTV
jgi:hypothetical protein